MNLYIRILQFVKPYKLTVILSLLSSILYVLMNAFSLWMVSSLIGTIINPEGSNKVIASDSLNGRFDVLISELIGPGDQIHQLKMFCILLLGSFVLKNLFYYINNISLSYVQNNLIQDIRNSLYKHLQKLSLSFYDNNKTADISSIVLRDVSAMRTAFTQSIQKLINEPLNILVLIFMLFIISPKLTLIALITIPVSGFVIVKLGQSIRRKAKRSSIQIAGVMNILHETLTGIRIVKAFTREKFENKKFALENYKFYKLAYRKDRIKFLNTPLNDTIGVSMGAILLWVGGKEVILGNSLNPDDFMRFIIFLFAMLQPARKLGSVNSQIQTGLASAGRVFSILDTPIEIKNSSTASSIAEFENSIEFKSVSFKYENAKNESLKDINVSIAKGDTVALVGSSGAGKSTFVDLISRFYDIQGGRILIDGVNIKNIKLSSLRMLVGVVTQETILFNDTILNNIKYGDEFATIEDVKKASNAANALEFINELPEKFDTIIGEKGARLSGGQRQRIAIARAILKNPQILILDEATSSLDTESERKVQIAIDNLVKDRTVIVIAHRLSTIENADEILVFHDGEIIEKGKHGELLDKIGRYTSLYEIQKKEN
jgi:ATP-binding cassette, subfamily B, bacterial MsbA